MPGGRPNRLYKILDNYTPVTESGCWLWDGSTNNIGYGQARLLGKNMLVHRLAYMEKVGYMPWGKVVCHKCDVPLCINPSHLFEATQKENLKDMIKKGRAAWQK